LREASYFLVVWRSWSNFKISIFDSSFHKKTALGAANVRKTER
jgi:hypothetical protein